MNNDGFNRSKTKLLTYLVYVLLALLTVIQAWAMSQISNLPDRYVRLERYRCDIEDFKKVMDTLNEKLDRLIERQIYPLKN